MERQSKEESLNLWKLEKEHLDKANLNISPEFSTMMEVVDKKINDYTLTYNEYVDDIIKYLQDLEETDDIQVRMQQVENMYIHLTNKYSDNGK